MPRARGARLTRHNVLLFEGDYDELRRLYPGHATMIVRALVAAHLKQKRTGAPIEINLQEETTE